MEEVSRDSYKSTKSTQEFYETNYDIVCNFTNRSQRLFSVQ